MKRLLFVVVGLLVSLNLAYANDLLFKASNGALNQNSVGVKKLTDKEMAQVKGGLEPRYFEINGRYGNESGLVDRNNKVLQYSVSYVIMLENHEIASQSIYGYGSGTARSNYWFFKGFADETRGEYPVINIHYNGVAQTVKATFGVFNVNTNSFRELNSPLAQAILAKHGYDLARYAMGYDMKEYFNTRRFRYK